MKNLNPFTFQVHFSCRPNQNEVVYKNKDKGPSNQKLPHKKAVAGVPRTRFSNIPTCTRSREQSSEIRIEVFMRNFFKKVNLNHIWTIITWLGKSEGKLVVDIKKIKQM